MRRVDSLEKTLMLWRIGGRRIRGRQRMRWLDGISDSIDVSLSEVRKLTVVMDRDAWRAAIHGVTKSWTQLSDWTELNWTERVGHDWATELNWTELKESDMTEQLNWTELIGLKKGKFIWSALCLSFHMEVSSQWLGSKWSCSGWISNSGNLIRMEIIFSFKIKNANQLK